MQRGKQPDVSHWKFCKTNWELANNRGSEHLGSFHQKALFYSFINNKYVLNAYYVYNTLLDLWGGIQNIKVQS